MLCACGIFLGIKPLSSALEGEFLNRTTREVSQWRVLNGLYMSGAGETRTAFSVYLLDIPISPFLKCAIKLKKKKTSLRSTDLLKMRFLKKTRFLKRRNTEDLGRTESRTRSGVGSILQTLRSAGTAEVLEDQMLLMLPHCRPQRKEQDRHCGPPGVQVQ